MRRNFFSAEQLAAAGKNARDHVLASKQLATLLLPGENAAFEVEGHLLGVERGDPEVARDSVEKSRIGTADDINLAVQILGTEAESRHQDNFGFDVATDGTAGDG